jgi:thiol-disulfide isomerase/thioredoxin
MQDINSSEQENVFLANNAKVLMFYGSVNCGHCRNIKPFIENLSRTVPGLSVGYVECSRIKTENIEGFPTFVYYRNGQYVGTVVGANRDEVMRMVTK